MKYPEKFVKKVKTVYPDWQEMHKALEREDPIVGDYLRDEAYFSMSPAEIVEAFEQGHEQDVLKEAKRANKSLKLYVEWKAQKAQL